MTQAHDRNDYERSLRLEEDALRESLARGLNVEDVERAIRYRERLTVRWLREKPWLAGRGLAATVAAARRAHSASIARSRQEQSR